MIEINPPGPVSAHGSRMEAGGTPERAAGRASVVVIDGDVAVRQSFRFFLEVEGYEVHTFADAASAMASGAVRDAACLIVDEDLTDAGGVDFVAGLRADGVATPAILTASVADARLRARADAIGIRLVEKPLLGDTLKTTLELAMLGG